MDYFPESMTDIKKHLAKGYDALIWNTKHVLTKELFELAGKYLQSNLITNYGNYGSLVRERLHSKHYGTKTITGSDLQILRLSTHVQIRLINSYFEENDRVEN